MNRRGFLKLLGAAIAAPFVKIKSVSENAEYDERNKWLQETFPQLDSFLSIGAYDYENEWHVDDHDAEIIDEELTTQSSIAVSDDNGKSWTQAEIFPGEFLGWAMNDAKPGDTVTVFMGGSGDLFNFRAFINVATGDSVTLETIGMKGAGVQTE